MVKWSSSEFQGCPITSEVVAKAASVGSIEILQFFYDNDNRVITQQLPTTNLQVCVAHSVEWGGPTLAAAISSCHSDVAWWLHHHCPNARFDKSAALKEAVLAGNIFMAEWLLAHGASWPRRSPGRYLAHAVAALGRLDILQWLEGRGQLNRIIGLVVKAAEKGHLHVVRWLIDRDAAQNDHNKRLTDFGCECSLAIHTAVVYGHLQVARYLHVRSKTPENNIHSELQALEQKYQLQKLSAQLGPRNKAARVTGNTMAEAAGNGSVDIVDCEKKSKDRTGFFGDAVVAAADPGHLDEIKYSHNLQKSIDEGTRKRKRNESSPKSRPVFTKRTMGAAAFYGHISTIQWLSEHRSEGCTVDVMNAAAQSGYLDAIKWLDCNTKVGCTTAAMDMAATEGHLEVVCWYIH